MSRDVTAKKGDVKQMAVQQWLLVIAAKRVVKQVYFRLENVDAMFTKKKLRPPLRHRWLFAPTKLRNVRLTYPTCSDIHKTISIHVNFSFFQLQTKM